MVPDEARQFCLEQNWTALAARRAMTMEGHSQLSTNRYAREFVLLNISSRSMVLLYMNGAG